MSFVMTENEILREYREAKDRREQVQILADLNCCGRGEIAEFLQKCGEEVDKRLLPKTRKREGGAAADTHTAPPEETVMGPGVITTAPDDTTIAPVQEGPFVNVKVLRDLLRDVNGEAEIVTSNGRRIRGITLKAAFDAAGKMGILQITLEV